MRHRIIILVDPGQIDMKDLAVLYPKFIVDPQMTKEKFDEFKSAWSIGSVKAHPKKLTSPKIINADITIIRYHQSVWGQAEKPFQIFILDEAEMEKLDKNELFKLLSKCELKETKKEK